MGEKEVNIYSDSIRLDQFLKWAGLVQTGGEAKLLIQKGVVLVNGEKETRRGRMLKAGDLICLGAERSFRIGGEKGVPAEFKD